MYYIQPNHFASINSHAPTAAPHGLEAPGDPNAQTKSIIFGIFPFLDAYIANFYDLLLGQAIWQFPGRSAFRTPEPGSVLVRGASPNRTEVRFAVRAKRAPNRTEPKHHYFGPMSGDLVHYLIHNYFIRL